MKDKYRGTCVGIKFNGKVLKVKVTSPIIEKLIILYDNIVNSVIPVGNEGEKFTKVWFLTEVIFALQSQNPVKMGKEYSRLSELFEALSNVHQIHNNTINTLSTKIEVLKEENITLVNINSNLQKNIDKLNDSVINMNIKIKKYNLQNPESTDKHMEKITTLGAMAEKYMKKYFAIQREFEEYKETTKTLIFEYRNQRKENEEYITNLNVEIKKLQNDICVWEIALNKIQKQHDDYKELNKTLAWNSKLLINEYGGLLYKYKGVDRNNQFYFFNTIVDRFTALLSGLQVNDKEELRAAV